jgi:hypothetical protein
VTIAAPEATPHPAPGSVAVECKQCHRVGIVRDGQNVHDALICDCCPQKHNHGEAASQPGAAPCRPVTVHAWTGVKP